jgi:NCS1 family nucleobase:cation symporter-1
VLAVVSISVHLLLLLLQFGPGMPLEGRFWSVFWPAVTANVGYWATLSLNIPDFSR